MEKLRLGMILGAGPSLKRGLTAVPPKELRDGSPDTLPEFKDQVVDVVVGDVEQVLGHILTAPSSGGLEAYVSLALRAARTNPLAARTITRLYSAGFSTDPAFTDPKIESYTDALSGMGLEQWLPEWAQRVVKPDADPLDQFAFVHAVLEGRIRPLLLSFPVLAKIAGGELAGTMGQEGLKRVHESIRSSFYRSDIDHHYEDRSGKRLQRHVWKILDFEHARKMLRKLTESTDLPEDERAALMELRRHLHQVPLHPDFRTPGKIGGVNFNEIRHAVAHLNLAVTDGKVHLGRGLVLAKWLGGETNASLVAFDSSARVELVQDAWDLFVLSWACELAANLVDWWLSCTLLKRVPYPCENPHEAAEVPDYAGAATMVLAAIAASAGGLDD